MFDDKTTDLQIILNKSFENILGYDCMKNTLEQNLLSLFLKHINKGSFNFKNLELYLDSFNHYTIENSKTKNNINSNNLLGFNRIISKNGECFEFLGFYINQIKTSNNYSFYGIIYYSKDREDLNVYIPKQGNSSNNLDFLEIKNDMSNYFFQENYDINDELNSFNDDLNELLEIVSLLSSDEKINNLINSFKTKYSNELN